MPQASGKPGEWMLAPASRGRIAADRASSWAARVARGLEPPPEGVGAAGAQLSGDRFVHRLVDPPVGACAGHLAGRTLAEQLRRSDARLCGPADVRGADEHHAKRDVDCHWAPYS